MTAKYLVPGTSISRQRILQEDILIKKMSFCIMLSVVTTLRELSLERVRHVDTQYYCLYASLHLNNDVKRKFLINDFVSIQYHPSSSMPMKYFTTTNLT